jgi:hypothetical protein
MIGKRASFSVSLEKSFAASAPHEGFCLPVWIHHKRNKYFFTTAYGRHEYFTATLEMIIDRGM